jgi:hypothetical protein
VSEDHEIVVRIDSEIDPDFLDDPGRLVHDAGTFEGIPESTAPGGLVHGIVVGCGPETGTDSCLAARSPENPIVNTPVAPNRPAAFAPGTSPETRRAGPADSTYRLVDGRGLKFVLAGASDAPPIDPLEIPRCSVQSWLQDGCVLTLPRGFTLTCLDAESFQVLWVIGGPSESRVRQSSASSRQGQAGAGS